MNIQEYIKVLVAMLAFVAIDSAITALILWPVFDAIQFEFWQRVLITFPVFVVVSRSRSAML